ncbi:DUF1007 family protein [Consotaella aegiceratis]|uniref:DUF1007 family protein n=1 Tax=Consotaella aegiceratis TaxID=3097961 RepID=UPI002F3F9CCD
MALRPLAFLGATIAFAALPTAAEAHPHVFVDATMEIVGTPDGHLAAVHNIWWMDELFSSSVIPDFDKNANYKLDPDELAAVGKQVRSSIAEWSFYTFVRTDKGDVEMQPPPVLNVSYDDKRGQLLFDFTMKPKQPLDMKKQAVSFSNFDNTYFVAFDFKDGIDSFKFTKGPKSCSKKLTVPTPDEAANAWMQQLSQLGVDAEVPADGIKFSEVLSTRMTIDCTSG